MCSRLLRIKKFYIGVEGYFEVLNKSTHTRNAITAVPDTKTRNAEVPIAMPIQ
jgi:hypothetical protein